MRCVECTIKLVPTGTKRTPGVTSKHMGRGLCQACYAAARRAGRLLAYPLVKWGVR